MTRWLGTDGKSQTERLALAYTPLWVSVVAWLMYSRAFDSFGEAGLLLLGFGLALPLWLLPLFIERERPLLRRHALRWGLLIAAFSALQNAFGAQLFFERFGMRYGFHTQLLWRGTPLFLYPMTVAYFSTYYAVMQVTFRRAARALGHDASREPLAAWSRRPRGLLLRALLGYAMAFAETATMASPLLAGAFSYDDPAFVRTWGSLAYGSIFFLSLPLFLALDEPSSAPRQPLGKLLWDLCACNTLCLVVYEGWSALFALLR